jgi:cytochrome c-type biogenesis protein CcmH
MTTTFWLIALSLAIVAAAFILIPLVRQRQSVTDEDRARINVVIYEEGASELREQLESGEISQSDFDHLETELKKNLLQDTHEGEIPTGPRGPDLPWLPIAMALLVPVFAVIAYSDFGLGWGSIDDVELAREFVADEPHGAGGGAATDMATSVERLAKRLEDQPDNDQGWMLLAQSYRNVGQFNAAAGAFKHLIERYPEDPILASYYAESLFLADDRIITQRVQAAMDVALELEPRSIAMLEIQAMDAFARDDLVASINFFREALAAGAEGERAQAIEQAISGVEATMVQRGLTPPESTVQAPRSAPPPMVSQSATAGKNPAAGSGRRIDVLVEATGGVEASPDASVFVFARAWGGPPMPLAVQRMTLGDLPRLVTLDESMAMMEGMGLGNFDQVEVVARISSSGIANAKPDDYESLSGLVDLTGETGVIKLTIDKRIRDQ